MKKLKLGGAHNKQVDTKNNIYYYRAHQRLAKYVHVDRGVRGGEGEKIWTRKVRGRA